MHLCMNFHQQIIKKNCRALMGNIREKVIICKEQTTNPQNFECRLPQNCQRKSAKLENSSGKSLSKWTCMELKETIAHHTCPVGQNKTHIFWALPAILIQTLCMCRENYGLVQQSPGNKLFGYQLFSSSVNQLPGKSCSG